MLCLSLASISITINFLSMFSNSEIVWGSNFDSVESDNVPMDCTYQGKEICCSTFKGIPSAEKKVLLANTTGEHTRRRQCVIDRKYIPSAYETRNIEFAAKLATMSEKDADKALVDFHVADAEMDAVNIWLGRVKYRMLNRGQYEEVSTDDDFKYMSRFHITKRCAHSKLNAEWDEWIEPLTIHARHPYGVGCGRGDMYEIQKKKPNYPGPRYMMNVDYVLTLTGDAFANHTNSKTLLHNGQRHGGIAKKMFFDAGTSTFDSSMRWFTCAYSQNKMYMDVLYGYEVTLLEPTSFWDIVPNEISQIYHFYNIPITKNITANHNPLKIIKDTANVDDFVSFKLDIDTPSVEIPLALQIASDPSLAELIDEFFIEIHFNCPLLKGCWGTVPEYVDGLKLDRVSAMKLLQKYRTMGIRSHFWP